MVAENTSQDTIIDMSILLLDVPGLHLGYLGFYGNPWVATPNLDRLASQAVVFDRHFEELRIADCGLRIQAQAAGILKLQSVIEPAENSESLEESFPQVVDGILAAADEGMSPIWARFPSLASPWRLSPELLGIYFQQDSDSDEPAAQAREPWPDPPVRLPPGDGHLERLQDTYAAVVTFMDAQIGGLIEELEERKILDRFLLVFTSQDALPLGEHGWIGRQRAWQHEEQVHLPLLMRLPEAAEAGLRIGALTQTVDIVPTLLDFLAERSSPGGSGERETMNRATRGFSLWPLIRQEVTEIRPFACSADQVGDSAERSLRTLDHALLLPLATPPDDAPRGPQLYVKPDDRWEVNNVIHHHAEKAEELEKSLRQCSPHAPREERAQPSITKLPPSE